MSEEESFCTTDEVFSVETEEDDGLSQTQSGEESESVDEPPPPKKKSSKPTERVFKLVSDSIISQGNSPEIDPSKLTKGGGRYTGKNPMQAGKKAFTKIYRASGVSDKKLSYVFSIQEVTSGGGSKVFTYIGVREKLQNPKTVSRGDSSYAVNYTSTVKAYRKK